MKSSKYIKENYILYLFLVPAFVYFTIYHFLPIFGMRIAFQDYRILGENVFVGLKHFRTLFSSPVFFNVLLNTITISAMKLLFIFPVPILLALMINEVKLGAYRKLVQCAIYLPHFLSWVIIAGIWISLLSPSYGAVNQVLRFFGGNTIDFMTNKLFIRQVLIVSETWRSAGWDSIIYVAAIVRISPVLYEAAYMDGANRAQNIWYITLPQLGSTIITVFILNCGFFMSAGFDQVFNFMNDSVISKIDILDTYVYRIGLMSGQFSISTAASFFKGVIGMVLILGSHYVAKRYSGKGLW